MTQIGQIADIIVSATASLRRGKALPDSVFGEFRNAKKLQLFHDLAARAIDGLEADFQASRDFLDLDAFRDHLKNFSLTRT